MAHLGIHGGILQKTSYDDTGRLVRPGLAESKHSGAIQSRERTHHTQVWTPTTSRRQRTHAVGGSSKEHSSLAGTMMHETAIAETILIEESHRFSCSLLL